MPSKHRRSTSSYLKSGRTLLVDSTDPSCNIEKRKNIYIFWRLNLAKSHLNQIVLVHLHICWKGPAFFQGIWWGTTAHDCPKITFDGLGGPPVPWSINYSRNSQRETIISPPEKGCKSTKIQKFLSSRNSPHWVHGKMWGGIYWRYPLGPIKDGGWWPRQFSLRRLLE